MVAVGATFQSELPKPLNAGSYYRRGVGSTAFWTCPVYFLPQHPFSATERQDTGLPRPMVLTQGMAFLMFL